MEQDSTAGNARCSADYHVYQVTTNAMHATICMFRFIFVNIVNLRSIQTVFNINYVGFISIF